MDYAGLPETEERELNVFRGIQGFPSLVRERILKTMSWWCIQGALARVLLIPKSDRKAIEAITLQVHVVLGIVYITGDQWGPTAEGLFPMLVLCTT